VAVAAVHNGGRRKGLGNHTQRRARARAAGEREYVVPR
jgi:hypothetical protein